MYLQPFLIYGSVLVLVCLVVLLIVIAFLYSRLNKAFYALSMDFTLYKKDNEKKAAEALEMAQAKAQQIIKDTQFFSEEMKKEVLSSVNKSISEGHLSYEQIISDVGRKSGEDIKNETSQMTSIYKEELQKEKETFKKSLEEGEQKILDEVKAKASTMLSEILSETVRKSLSKEESEKLVMDSLEEVKKEYGL